MENGEKVITEQAVEDYRKYLEERELGEQTIRKYIRDIHKLSGYMDGQRLAKTDVIAYKDFLNKSGYKVSSINSFLAAANSFFRFMGWDGLCVKALKVQKNPFLPQNREMTKQDYKNLVKTARSKGNERLAMLLVTLCGLGLRVSEISAVTVDAVKSGVVSVYNKSKGRQVAIPRKLQVELLGYIRKAQIRSGYVFGTSTGNVMDRSYIWREMKKLCEAAGVDRDKVFPHNLRHLFARVFYGLFKDIVKLADILGHSSIETTKIYLKESFTTHRKHLEKMDLLLE